MKSPFEGPLPTGPVALHIESAVWNRMSKAARLVRGRPRQGTVCIYRG
jgi:hypothetical protein